VTPENYHTPDRALRERQADLGWIVGNLDLFWTAAIAAFEDAGRGAIVVDTTSQPVPGAGHSFAYFSQEQVEDHGNEDAVRQVSECDPGTNSSSCCSSPATAPAPTGCATCGQGFKRIWQTQ